MADTKNYDRLPEESLSELRRKYLRDKPLYGPAPTVAAYPPGAVKTRHSQPVSGYKSSHGPRRAADAIMTVAVLIIAALMIFAPISTASGTDNYLDIHETRSAFEYLLGDDGAFTSIGSVNGIEAIKAWAVTIILIVSLVTVVLDAIRTVSSFFRKNSDGVRIPFVKVLIEMLSYHAMLAVFGREQAMGDSTFVGFMPSEALSTVTVIVGAATAVAAILSYVKGFKYRILKKPAWWSSAILTALYSVIAVSLCKMNLFGVFRSMIYALEIEDGGYSATNSGFEMFIIFIFNVFIIFAFFKILNNVKKALTGDLNCLLGFGLSGVKMSPTPKSRLKAAIWPIATMIVISILGDSETGIGWSIYGLTERLTFIVIASVAIWIACLVLHKKTKNVFA